MNNTIIKFKDRRPALPSRWKGVELQFYERYSEGDVIAIVDGEEIVKEYAYKVYLLPWRPEFDQGAEYDEYGEIIKKDYITEHFNELFTEAKQI